MSLTIECPKCGAPVDYDPNSAESARCSYCNSLISQSSDAQGCPAFVVSQVSVELPQVNTRPLKWLLLLFLLPPLAGIVIAILAVVGAFTTISRVAIPSFRFTPGNTNSSSTREKPSVTGPARLVMKFGGEGIGPGMFTDARSIAVDAAGRIYVGEYTGGRIQVFDATGKFITQWMVGDRKTILRGLAADRKGTVYVTHDGQIFRHEGTTGALLGPLDYAEGRGFVDLTAAADGGLVAAWYRNRDDVVRFDPKGTPGRVIKAAISTASGDSELDTHVTIDGRGNIFALGTFNNAVFKFSPDGKFITRFGSAGEQPGQLRGAHAIAADGQGRIYVSDTKGIQVFDGDGRYLNLIKPEGSAFGMVFNDAGEMLVVTRRQILKLAVEL
jgi:sugar lactone lactonase YvrE